MDTDDGFLLEEPPLAFGMLVAAAVADIAILMLSVAIGILVGS